MGEWAQVGTLNFGFACYGVAYSVLLCFALHLYADRITYADIPPPTNLCEFAKQCSDHIQSSVFHSDSLYYSLPVEDIPFRTIWFWRNLIFPSSCSA